LVFSFSDLGNLAKASGLSSTEETLIRMGTKKKSLALGLSGITIVSLLTGVFVFHTASGVHADSSGFTAFTRTITRGATVTVGNVAPAADAPITDREFAIGPGDDGTGSTGKNTHRGVNRSFTNHGANGGNGSDGTTVGLASSNPELAASFDGLNHRQQRLANGGNQFSVEPPDQGLCANSQFEFESLNDVLQVYDQAGTPKLNSGHAVDLNSFYGYPAAFHRPSGPFGQFITDPSCYWDQATQRWFQLVLTIEVDPVNGPPDFLGPNHLDLAVSTSPDPTGSFVIYHIPVQDDGTDGTPNHKCSLGPCFGDYPHLGADANGIYLTTNEYSFFGPEFHGAQIYAISKAALAANDATITVTQFDTHQDPSGSGFTIWPATAPSGTFDSSSGGTEYFLSSTAADEVTCPSGCVGPRSSNNILEWTLTNTSSLDTSTPALTLANTSIGVTTYSAPPKAIQEGGPIPLGTCLTSTSCATNFLLGAPDPFAPEKEYALDSNDTRMQQVTLANGKLWGALDTDVKINGQDEAGIAYYIVDPGAASIVLQGQVGMHNTSLIYPAIGVLANGSGVVTFTLVGNSLYPSAAYASIDATSGFGAVHTAASGAGPADGFSGYVFFNAPNPNRPRWGDYGYTAVVGNNIWIASEYIGQTCDIGEYKATGASCGGTRTVLANWDTRISEVTP
jgi:hypothetical protein